MAHRCWPFCLLALSGALLGCRLSDSPGAPPAPPAGAGPSSKGGSSAGAAGAPNSMAGRPAVGGGAGMAGRSMSPDGSGTGASAGRGGTEASSGSGGASATGGSNPEPGDGFEGEGTPWDEPAPRATCGAGETADGELQGEGVANVRCNFEIKGQVEAAHFLSLAWHGDCAYVNSTTATTVIDVSDSSRPTVVRMLATTGMQNNWESMKVHEGRGLLVGYQADGPVLDVYDVSQDCKEPVLQASFNVGGLGHSGNFSPDGTIYYASSLYSSEVFAVDLTDPKQPKVITSDFVDAGGSPIGSHDLFVGKDGTRGYFTFPSLINFANGTLAIVDLSQVQARAPGAQGKSIKEIEWQDGAASQYPIPLTYRGEDYLMVTDELGSGGCGDPAKPQFGYAHIFDIRDEMNPTLVSQVKTEAQDPAHCERATQSAGTFFGVGTHYCNVDRLDDPRLLSCGLWGGGVRVFDIRNPWRPKEVAYFDTAGVDDWVPGLTRILTDERELWVATTGGVFYVLKFADGLVDEILAD